MRLPLIGAILAFLLAAFIQARHPQINPTQGVHFQFNERPTVSAEGLRFISFGYSRLLSNLLWLRFLQETPIAKVPPGELSWIYFDLDTISTLDPDFYPVFEHGGIFLSVFTEDKIGAERLLNKGVRLHPDRWRIHAYLAYHYHIELGDADRAAPFYLSGSRLPGAAEILGILAARHIAKKQTIGESIAFLEELRRTTTSEAARTRLTERIEMWKQKQREQTAP